MHKEKPVLYFKILSFESLFFINSCDGHYYSDPTHKSKITSLNSVAQNEAAPQVQSTVASADRAADFLLAIRTRDYVKLHEFQAENNQFLPNGRLGLEDESYLKDAIEPIITKFDLEHREWGRKGNDFAIIFFPASDKNFIDSIDIEYLRSEFMKRYFICDFSEIGGKWKLQNGFCFSEMDGPYEGIE